VGAGTSRRIPRLRPGATALAAAALALAAPVAARAEVEPIPKPEGAQRRHFAIFNTAPETPPPVVAGSIRTWLESKEARDRGFNAELIQQAQPPGPRRSIWVIPGTGEIMLVEVAAASSGRPYPKIAGFDMSSTLHAIRRGLGLSVVPSHSIGLVPDGVIRVRLSRTLVAPVGQNVFAASGGLDSWFDRWRFMHGASATGG
jgi:hypothetical protein